MREIKKILIFSFLLILNGFVFANDPFWTCVIAGRSTANPVSWNKNIYFVGKDKGLNCISIDGSFVWRRNTDGVGNFISLSPSGLIFVSTQKGKLQAFSSQGIPIWTFDLNETPVFAPYTGLDGRIFVLSSKTVFCFSQHGVLKWKRKLNSPPVLNVTETGNGEIILVLKNGDFLRYSIFGHLNEEKRLVKTVSAISRAPAGYLMACTDCSLFYYKTVAGSESVWQAKTSSPCVALACASGKYLAVCADGSIWFSTISKNEEVWFSKLEKNFSAFEPQICFLKDEIHITSKGYGASILSDGTLRWQFSIPEKTFHAVITENGMLVGVSGKIVNAYRMEVKFLRKNPHAEILDDSYDILGNIPNDIPPVFDSAGSQKFFNDIYADLKNGSLAQNEPLYAATLIGIMQNKWYVEYGQYFTPPERAEAAKLLGLFGSYEYRNYLIEAGYKTSNRIIQTGIVKGLSLIAYDPDGKTLKYLEHVILRTAHDDEETMRAVCNCLEELSKFGDNTIISNSLSELFLIINGRFTNKIKYYARQKIKNIVQ